MFDPKQLLDSFLGASAQSSPSNAQAMQQNQTGGQGRQAPGGGLGGMLGGLSDVFSNPNALREKAGQVMDYARQNPMAAGAVVAGLFGTGIGRSLAGSALKYGGLAAVAGMAYKAYQDHQAGKTPGQAAPAGAPDLEPPPSDTGFHPSEAPQGEGAFALSLVRAMIAAAKADGVVDEEERKHIGDRARLSGMDSEAAAFLAQELARPADLDGLAAEAKTEAQRVELYTASRLAINPDNPAETNYLSRLAAKLGLEPALVRHVEATVASAQAA